MSQLFASGGQSIEMAVTLLIVCVLIGFTFLMNAP